jgi:hypothetical protein
LVGSIEVNEGGYPLRHPLRKNQFPHRRSPLVLVSGLLGLLDSDAPVPVLVDGEPVGSPGLLTVV